MFSSLQNLFSSNRETSSESSTRTTRSLTGSGGGGGGRAVQTTAATTKPSKDSSSSNDWNFLTNPKNELISILNEELHCSICLELFENPVFLECRHTFCQHHISELQARDQESTSTKGLLCPLCRFKTNSDKLKKLKPDSFRERLVQALKKARLNHESTTSKTPSSSFSSSGPIATQSSSQTTDLSTFTNAVSELVSHSAGVTSLRTTQTAVEQLIDTCFETLVRDVSSQRELLLTQTKSIIEREVGKQHDNGNDGNVSMQASPTLLCNGDLSSEHLMPCKRAIMQTLLSTPSAITPRATAVTTLKSDYPLTTAVSKQQSPMLTVSDHALVTAVASAPLVTTPSPANDDEPEPPDGIYSADRTVPGTDLSTSWCYAGTADAIGFSVSSPVELHGFGLYGGQGSYDCRISLKRAFKEIASRSVQFTNNDTSITKVFFTTPIRLEPKIVYNAVAMITGWGSYYIRGCTSKLAVSGRASEGSARQRVQFTFVDATPPTNGTNVDGGQIPVLLFKFL
eukprot:TRINITY_DN3943_c0_g1_i1.p1 TRINITY_DN3943_c0_g1~~TRINITY_DN3943_c0_g1_i1.p1  ORF type:complete len:513 (+),score=104.09 TRINITY_DN3943_c0_g1_i1:97-1635(+)